MSKHGTPLPNKVWKLIDVAKLHAAYFLNPAGKAPFPQSIGISVNSICNLRCAMCDVGQRNETGEFYKKLSKSEVLDLSNLFDFIDLVSTHNPRAVVSVNSTEPLLYPDLFHLLCYLAREKRLVTSVTTNGYLLKEKAEQLVESRINRIAVSIDGVGKTHDEIRGVRGSFEKAVEGIETVKILREKHGLQHPTIEIAVTILPCNVEELSRIPEFFFPLVDRIIFTHMNFVTQEMAQEHNSAFGNLIRVSPSSVSRIDPKDMNTRALLSQIKHIKKHYGERAFFSPDLESAEQLHVYYTDHLRFVGGYRKCSVPWRNVQILPNGDVTPAARCFNFVYGNILSQSFEDIWNGEKARTFRKRLRHVGATPACARCCGLFSSRI